VCVQTNHDRVYRIQKEISVSRSIGDRDFKYPYCKDIWEETECTGDLVISTPEIVTYNLDGSDEFLIIACDGISYPTLRMESDVK
jgi:serine/threonine protein phosphatase PrpC